jgi:hypothetical protein
MSQNINKKIYNRINYSLIFNSLITIDTIKFLSLASTNYRKGFKQHKLFIKQSYMLLTWVIYNSSKSTNAFILPRKTKKMTIVKSPMAHKTFSQEQLKWEYYKLVIPYVITENKEVSGVNQAMHFILQTRGGSISRDSIGTNLLFLKKSTIRYFFVESEYFML